MLIANATGCSSIYGGNLPTTPYCRDANGRGPAWSNSLFEDAAEFGYGMRLGADAHKHQAEVLLKRLGGQLGDDLVGALVGAEQYGEANIAAQRERIEILKVKLRAIPGLDAARLLVLADYLVRKSVWSFGGDGWAYDIGYGAWTTSWPSRGTSTSWCSTPRSTPTPAARPASPPRSARRPSSPRPASRWAEGPGPDGHELSPRLRRVGALGPRTPRWCRPSRRPTATPARR